MSTGILIYFKIIQYKFQLVYILFIIHYRNSTTAEQARLVELVWGLWPLLPQYGRKAAQFVDLLGYFSLKTPGIHLGVFIFSFLITRFF